MIFDVGDRVRIRSDLEHGKQYGSYNFVKHMIPYTDMEATIVKKYPKYYRLDVDDQGWMWTDEMISGYVIENDDPIDNFEFDVNVMLGV